MSKIDKPDEEVGEIDQSMTAEVGDQVVREEGKEDFMKQFRTRYEFFMCQQDEIASHWLYDLPIVDFIEFVLKQKLDLASGADLREAVLVFVEAKGLLDTEHQKAQAFLNWADFSQEFLAENRVLLPTMYLGLFSRFQVEMQEILRGLAEMEDPSGFPGYDDSGGSVMGGDIQVPMGKTLVEWARKDRENRIDSGARRSDLGEEEGSEISVQIDGVHEGSLGGDELGLKEETRIGAALNRPGVKEKVVEALKAIVALQKEVKESDFTGDEE